MDLGEPIPVELVCIPTGSLVLCRSDRAEFGRVQVYCPPRIYISSDKMWLFYPFIDIQRNNSQNSQNYVAPRSSDERGKFRMNQHKTLQPIYATIPIHYKNNGRQRQQ